MSEWLEQKKKYKIYYISIIIKINYKEYIYRKIIKQTVYSLKKSCDFRVIIRNSEN